MEHSEHPSPEKQRFIYQHEIFELAAGLQAELDLMRFATIEEAVTQARIYANELDTVAQKEELFDKPATLLGDDVIVPVTYYDHALGSVHITMERAGKITDALPDTYGDFFGFTGAALMMDDDRFRPLLTHSVKLRPLNATNFHGILLASGPVDSTVVSFLDDELSMNVPDGQ